MEIGTSESGKFFLRARLGTYILAMRTTKHLRYFAYATYKRSIYNGGCNRESIQQQHTKEGNMGVDIRADRFD